MAAGDVEITIGARPTGGSVRRRLLAGCLALAGTCTVAVAATGPDEPPRALRSPRSASPSIADPPPTTEPPGWTATRVAAPLLTAPPLRRVATPGVATSTPSTTSTTSSDPEEIREDIERTRENLADTVDALHAKLDVKSQAKARVARAKDQATTADGKPRPELIAGAVGVVVLVAGLIWLRRR